MRAAPETITTARLVLRRPKPSDAAAMYDYGRDPEVTRYMDWRTHASLADARAFLKGAARRWESGEEYSWAITVKRDDRRIGSVGCRVRGHAVDLGYVLSRNYWGRGYATEAARAVLEWARARKGVYRVWATCDVENTASARVLEKLGMSREGVLRRWAIRPNLPSQLPRDAFVYSWVREA
jgi:[ribosomal protein S5]-alanine N-acetyltransferase